MKYLVIFLTAISFMWSLKVLSLTYYPDFTGYYYGAEHVIHGENPYSNDRNYFTPQVDTPFSMIFFIPLTIIPFSIAAKVWIVISILAIIIVLYLSTKMYQISLFSSTTFLICFFTFLSFPVKFNFGMGQINACILLFITLFLYYLNKHKNIKAGMFLAVALLFKFFPLLLIPYFFYLKNWKLLAAVFVTTFLLMLVTAFFIPPSLILDYFQHMLPKIVSSWKGDYYNQALSGLLMREIRNSVMREKLRLFIQVVMVLINSFVIFIRKQKNSKRINLEIASLLSLSILINSFSWQHHFIFLILSFVIIIYTLSTNKKKKNKNRTLSLLLFVSYVLISLNFSNPQILPILLQSHVFFGGLLLWGLSLFMLWKYKL